MAPYASLNLGDHVGDAPEAVAENRAVAARALELSEPASWWFLDQVHGASVVIPDGPNRGGGPPRADAAVTSVSEVVLVVLTADCAPIALVNDEAVGVVHTGWKGLEAGVVARAVAELQEIGDGPVRAVIGPCIRPARYEFGRTDLDRLVARFGPAVEGHTDDDRPALDLAAGVRIAFAEVGVTDVVDRGWCTAAEPDRYFSHRRDGVTGRQGVVVVKEA